jgi:AcrR family transcriptional regulator
MLGGVTDWDASVNTGEPSDGILGDVVAAEMGDEMADAVRRMRQAEEARYREEHPREGLRERKRRLTRKLISDAATMLFASRGFDTVRVSEIADRVGVSEKTIYNYFPNKESMVLDEADELVEGLAAALRDRPPGVSVTGAVLAALVAEATSAPFMDDELAEFVPQLVAMIERTPALHAHWLQVHDRLARVAAEELAIQAGTAPRDPEAVVAGRALVGLVEVNMESSVRHIVAGLRGADLREAVLFDIRRAARLLDTGLSSLARGAQTGGAQTGGAQTGGRSGSG